MHTLLLVQIFNYRGILTRQRLEALFPPRIRQTAAIENKSAAVAALILQQTAMKRKTENPHGQVVRFGGQPLQLLRSQHAVEFLHQGRQRDRQLQVVQQPAQIFQRIRNALQEMGLTFVKSPEPIRSQSLQNPHINVSIRIMEKLVAIHLDKGAYSLQVKPQQLLPQLRGQICLRIVEQGSDVILQRSFSPTLIIKEERLPIAQHD